MLNAVAFTCQCPVRQTVNMVFRFCVCILLFTGSVTVLDAKCLQGIVKHCTDWKDQGYCKSQDPLFAVVMTIACKAVCSNISGITGIQQDPKSTSIKSTRLPPFMLLKQGVTVDTGIQKQRNRLLNSSPLPPFMILKQGITVYSPPEPNSSFKTLCHKSPHGCCSDGKTPADGPHKLGCAMKLCVDLKVCKKYKNDKSDQGCATKNADRLKWLKTYCPYTCDFCKKALSPKQECEARNPQWGCCWNGDPATGPNNKGCPACNDLSQHVCRQWKDNCQFSPFYTTRLFMQLHCPRTCGRCDCSDSYDKCDRWKLDGFCHARHSWRNFMRTHCRLTCGFCASDSG